MLKITNLGSGSSGNATVLQAGETKILIDAGFNNKQLNLRAATKGIALDDLDGIVISHEHGDHVCGLRVFNKKTPATVFASAATLASKPLVEASLPSCEAVEAGSAFQIKDVTVTPFSIPHDAADPLAYTFQYHGLKVGYLSDAGFPTELARHHLQDCHALMLEFNHDRKMLADGAYPWPIKQRIMGRNGHLNNVDAAGMLSDVIHPDMQTVLLAHMSQNNNTAELALESYHTALNGNQPDVFVLTQSSASDSVIVRS